MKTRVVVVGAGTGGYWAAIRAAQLDAEVFLVEAEKIGGTCLNLGCIPSKIWVETSRTMERLRKTPEFQSALSDEVKLALKDILKRKETVIQTLSAGIGNILRKNGVRYIRGYGRIQEQGRLRVDAGEKNSDIPWDRLILATGSRPITLPQIPVDGKIVWTSDHVLDLKYIPESVLIVGGGVIGCEFACIFSSLGSRVTVVEALDRILPIEGVDEDISKTLEREMKKKRIQLFTRHFVTSIKIEDGKARVVVTPVPEKDSSTESGGKPQEMEAHRILVCVGRGPRMDFPGLAAAGVKIDEKGWIRVNEKMETSAPGIYAIGDALGPYRPMLAHVASAEGLVAAENAAGGRKSMDYGSVPTAIFTTPEAAGVGLTESQANKKGLEIRTDTALFRSLGKAHVIDEIAGFAKIVSHRKTRKILGVHIIGPHAADLIAQGVLAISAGMTVEVLADTIFAHPTLSEVLMEAALKAAGRPVHG